MDGLREIVIHVDDLGNSHGANVAFADLFAAGAVTCGAVMVPCPWFPETAAMARAHPEYDLGVHLTLNAEYEGYRWRPLTGVGPNGLSDVDGFMWRDVASARRADPAAVEAELRAQIDAALAAGIEVTHLDSHMGTVMMPEFVDIYLRLGRDYRLPIVLPRTVLALGRREHPPETVSRYAGLLDALAAGGNPDFAAYVVSGFGSAGATADYYRRLFAGLPEGLSWGAFHMTAPGDFSAISPDAPMRAAEYELFASGQAAALLAEAGVRPVGMRAFRERLRAR